MTTTPRDYTVFCLSEASQPITHMKNVSGNEALIARSPVVTPRGIQWVPQISGNALRHRLVREPGARWLIWALGLGGTLSLVQLNYLLHGGSLTEGGGRENVRLIADMQRLFPLLRLIGGCLPSQVVPGSLLTWAGMLVCEENRRSLASMLPEGWSLPEQALRPAETFVSGYQYVRGDVTKQNIDLLRPDMETPEKSQLMPFSGQQVVRGSCFFHGFVLRHCSFLELGALLWSIRLWQAEGGTVGGQGARGHGRLETLLYCGENAEEAVAAYRSHVAANEEECRAWMAAAFAAKPSKPAKAAKGKKAAPVEASNGETQEAE